MDIFKILGLCLCALCILSVLRQYVPSYWVAAALACGVVILGCALRLLEPALSFVREIAGLAGGETIGIVLKASLIAILTQSVQDSCAQAGQTSLAGHVELAGKAAVLLAALPLFQTLIDTLGALLR